MGGEQSLSEQDIDIPTINHPKFTHVQFLKANEIMKTSLSLDNYSDFQKWEEELNKVAKFDDEVLLFPKAYECIRKAVCGSSAALNIEFDNYQYVLEEELENRFKIHKHFSQQQVWYLLYSLCQAAHDFRSINSKVGDIRPANVFINEDGQIKVSNLYSWPCETTNYDKTIFDKELTYIAPEQVQGTKEGKIEMFIDKYQAQSFSLGLTVLETGLLQPCSKLYDPKLNSFDRYELTKIIKQWWELQHQSFDEETGNSHMTQYSAGLKLAVAALCDINPDERLTSQQVYNWLKPYKDNINSLQKFQSGLPVVNNMAKYQPFLLKYQNQKQQQQVNIPQQAVKVGGASTDKPVNLNQGYPVQSQPQYQPRPQYQPYPQYQPQVMKQPVYQNYEPRKVNQQPNLNNFEKKNYQNTLNQNKGDYSHLNSNYAFFSNAADSHKHQFAYTPNPINPDAIKDQFHQISHYHHTLHPQNHHTNQLPSQTINTNNISTNKNNAVSYQGHQSTTVNQQITKVQKKVQGNDSNNFLKRIDEALAKSRQNNPS